MVLWIQQSLGRTHFPRLGLFPSWLVEGKHTWCFRVCTIHLCSQKPCGQLASTYRVATEHPVVQACLPLHPTPIPRWWTCCSLLCFVSYHRYWDQEVKRAEKDAREPSLMKAIIKCYWKSYVVWGIFTFLEVKTFSYSALLFRVCGSVLRWTYMERGQWLKVWG